MNDAALEFAFDGVEMRVEVSDTLLLSVLGGGMGVSLTCRHALREVGIIRPNWLNHGRDWLRSDGKFLMDTGACGEEFLCGISGVIGELWLIGLARRGRGRAGSEEEQKDGQGEKV